MSHPSSLAVDFAGNVYIADASSGYVHKFAADGVPLLSFQDAKLISPDSIAVDRGGAIYVADPTRGSVLIFYPDGTRLREIRCRSGRRQKENLGVTVDEDGNLFVVDAVGNRIQRFNPRGRRMKVWGGPGSEPGQMKSPVDAAIGPDGFLYVNDMGNSRIQKFTRDGEYLAAFVVPGPSAGSARMTGLAVSETYVFGADPEAHQIQVWTLEGKHKLSADVVGRPGAQPPTPGDLAVSPRGELFVLDPVAPRVLRFRINF